MIGADQTAFQSYRERGMQDPAKRVGGEKPSSHGPPLTLDKGQGIMDNGQYSLLQVKIRWKLNAHDAALDR